MTKVYDYYEALNVLSANLGVDHHGTVVHQKIEEALAEMRKEFKKDNPEVMSPSQEEEFYKSRVREAMDEETEALIREALTKESIEYNSEFGELRLVKNGRRVFLSDTIAFVDNLDTGMEDDYDLMWCGIIKR